MNIRFASKKLKAVRGAGTQHRHPDNWGSAAAGQRARGGSCPPAIPLAAPTIGTEARIPIETLTDEGSVGNSCQCVLATALRKS